MRSSFPPAGPTVTKSAAVKQRRGRTFRNRILMSFLMEVLKGETIGDQAIDQSSRSDDTPAGLELILSFEAGEVQQQLERFRSEDHRNHG